MPLPTYTQFSLKCIWVLKVGVKLAHDPSPATNCINMSIYKSDWLFMAETRMRSECECECFRESVWVFMSVHAALLKITQQQNFEKYLKFLFILRRSARHANIKPEERERKNNKIDESSAREKQKLIQLPPTWLLGALPKNVFFYISENFVSICIRCGVKMVFTLREFLSYDLCHISSQTDRP